jgi:hypothetical protein
MDGRRVVHRDSAAFRSRLFMAGVYDDCDSWALVRQCGSSVGAVRARRDPLRVTSDEGPEPSGAPVAFGQCAVTHYRRTWELGLGPRWMPSSASWSSVSLLDMSSISVS